MFRDRCIWNGTQTSPVTITCLGESLALIGPGTSQSAVSRVIRGRAIQMLWLSNHEGLSCSETLAQRGNRSHNRQELKGSQGRRVRPGSEGGNETGQEQAGAVDGGKAWKQRRG